MDETERSRALIEKTKTSLGAYSEYSADFQKKEYYDGKIFSDEVIHIRYSKTKNKIYGKYDGTFGKSFVFDYLSEQLEGKLALIPFRMTMKPFDKLSLEGHHHSVHKLGLHAFATYFHRFYDRATEDKAIKLSPQKILRRHGQETVSIRIDYLDFDQGRTETIPSFASPLELEQKWHSSINVIINANPGFDSYEDFTPGRRVYVPKRYCQWLNIYIASADNLLVGQEIYDNKGKIFNDYFYFNIKNQAKFSSKDFRP